MATQTKSRETTSRQTRSRSDERPRITAKNLRGDDRRFLERNERQLSRTTLRAKWIHSPDEHEDRPGQSLATREPDVIRAWAEARDARPVTVGRRDGERPRTLRFDFNASDDERGGSNGNGSNGGGRNRRLEPVDWDAWFETFRERQLVFVFQEHLRNGNDSNFFRLDSPERERG